MKQWFKKIMQPKRLFILIAAILILSLTNYFVNNWQIKTLAFLLILISYNILFYRFTDYFIENGIFTVPAYNLGSSILFCALISLLIFFTKPENPDCDLSIILLFSKLLR